MSRYGDLPRRESMTAGSEELALAPTVIDMAGPTLTDVVPAPREPSLDVTIDRRYRVTGCIVDGTATTVYRGVQLAIERPVVIEVLRAEGARDPQVAKLFDHDARILANVNHPNIVTILDGGNTDSGSPYLVLELVRGRTLEAELTRAGPFDTRRTCRVAIQLCSALMTAHLHGIVRWDLNLSNVMLLEDPTVRDVVKLLGFGVAASGARAAQLSPVTASVAASTFDSRDDLYALGRLMARLLTGSRHEGELAELPSTVDRPIARLVRSLLATAPEDRPAAALVHQQLQASLAEPPSIYTPAVPHAVASADAQPAAIRPTLQGWQELKRVLLPTPLASPPTRAPARRRTRRYGAAEGVVLMAALLLVVGSVIVLVAALST